MFLFCVAIGALAGGPARAQEDAPTVLDSGRFLVLSGNQVVATEEFEYLLSPDSITVSALMTRRARGQSGADVEMKKRMILVVNTADFGLRSYVSNQDFEGRQTVKGVIPGDTTMTVYAEMDGAGGADKLVQPPGKLFMMDPGLFTLFDVICHSLKGKTFTKRPVQIVALADPPATVEATVAVAGADTVTWGGKRTITKRLQFRDPSGDFVVWVDEQSRMLRLEHGLTGLTVMREEPASAAPKKKPAAAPAKKPAARKPAGTR